LRAHAPGGALRARPSAPAAGRYDFEQPLADNPDNGGMTDDSRHRGRWHADHAELEGDVELAPYRPRVAPCAGPGSSVMRSRPVASRIDNFCQHGRLGFEFSAWRMCVATMNVSLPAEFIEFVEGEVASGEYGTASEVVREALRALRREKAAHEEKLAVLRREIAVGAEQARQGRLSGRSIADIATDLRKKRSP
jgi:antitoxin ParD1/3/4